MLETSPTSGFDARTVQPAASRYTGRGTGPTLRDVIVVYFGVPTFYLTVENLLKPQIGIDVCVFCACVFHRNHVDSYFVL